MSAIIINIQSKSSKLSIYKELLRKAIEEVSLKINVDVSDITWYIVSEKNLQDNIFLKSIINSHIAPIVKKYGRCNILEKKVEISTNAIESYGIDEIISRNKLLYQKLQQNRILLADVIMDEIAHIVSKKTHGNIDYENLLTYYHKQFYNSKLNI